MTENTTRRAVCINLKMAVTVILSMVIYIGNDNMRKKEWLRCKMKKAVLRRRGEVREGEGRVNPVTVSGEHSGVVRGLYKTLSMNDSKHLNDREMGRCGCMCVCVCGTG